MRTFVVTLLVALAMHACLVPSMAAAPQTNDLSAIPCSLVVMVNVINDSIDVVSAWVRRRRRRWNGYNGAGLAYGK